MEAECDRVSVHVGTAPWRGGFTATAADRTGGPYSVQLYESVDTVQLRAELYSRTQHTVTCDTASYFYVPSCTAVLCTVHRLRMNLNYIVKRALVGGR